jgi:hypothetical protein
MVAKLIWSITPQLLGLTACRLDIPPKMAAPLWITLGITFVYDIQKTSSKFVGKKLAICQWLDID